MNIKFDGLKENNYDYEYLSKVSYDLYKDESIDFDLTEEFCDILLNVILKNYTAVGIMGKIIDCKYNPIQGVPLTLSLGHFVHGDGNYVPIGTSTTNDDGVFSFILDDYSNGNKYLISL
ncbi:MAG: hypothetical protein ACRC28_00670 [Clostridium sp.]|uniref:hypothetical protein n=1 Tax=Clostridium sp. TaxID=1506 RepID=UPI003F2EA361